MFMNVLQKLLVCQKEHLKAVQNAWQLRDLVIVCVVWSQTVMKRRRLERLWGKMASKHVGRMVVVADDAHKTMWQTKKHTLLAATLEPWELQYTNGYKHDEIEELVTLFEDEGLHGVEISKDMMATCHKATVGVCMAVARLSAELSAGHSESSVDKITKLFRTAQRMVATFLELPGKKVRETFLEAVQACQSLALTLGNLDVAAFSKEESLVPHTHLMTSQKQVTEIMSNENPEDMATTDLDNYTTMRHDVKDLHDVATQFLADVWTSSLQCKEEIVKTSLSQLQSLIGSESTAQVWSQKLPADVTWEAIKEMLNKTLLAGKYTSNVRTALKKYEQDHINTPVLAQAERKFELLLGKVPF